MGGSTVIFSLSILDALQFITASEPVVQTWYWPALYPRQNDEDESE